MLEELGSAEHLEALLAGGDAAGQGLAAGKAVPHGGTLGVAGAERVLRASVDLGELRLDRGGTRARAGEQHVEVGRCAAEARGKDRLEAQLARRRVGAADLGEGAEVLAAPVVEDVHRERRRGPQRPELPGPAVAAELVARAPGEVAPRVRVERPEEVVLEPRRVVLGADVQAAAASPRALALQDRAEGLVQRAVRSSGATASRRVASKTTRPRSAFQARRAPPWCSVMMRAT